MPLLYPTSCKCSTESFVNSASPFPLLFFLEEKKQKKIICGTGFPAAPAAFAGLQHKNGRLTYEPAVFSLQAGCARKRLLSEMPPLSRDVFCFFSSRKEIVPPSFLFRRKEAKENHLPDLLLRFSLHFAQSCCAKRTAHIRAGRFFVSSWMCAKTSSVRNTPLSRDVFCFFSSRKEIVP